MKLKWKNVSKPSSNFANGCKRTMSDYDQIVSQIEERNAIRQQEWREKALARRSRGKGKTPYDDGSRFDQETDDDGQVNELPAHRRRRRRNQHLIPGECPLLLLYVLRSFGWEGAPMSAAITLRCCSL